MRIGIITAEIESTSGWAQVSHSLIAAMRENGMDLRVVGAEGAPADVPILPKLGESSGGTIARQMRAWRAVRRELRDCDVVHTLVEPFAPLGVLAAGRRPHLLTVHGTYAALPLMRRFPVGRLYRWAFERSVCACVSQYTQGVLKRAAPRAKSLFIPNGVDASRFTARASGLSPFAKNGPVILFVGGVKARKGAIHLARAMIAVRARFPQAMCVIAGSLSAEPDYVAQIRAEIAQHGLTETVLLPGHLSSEDILRWYLTADLFVVPSMNDGWKFEGFGLVHLEAGAFGIPAIGTRECGAAAAIDDGETGLLVSQHAIDAELPEAMIRILGDDVLRLRMGTANRAKAERMTWNLIARQYADLYTAELNVR